MERHVLGPRLLRAAQVIHEALPESRCLWSALPALGGVEQRLRRRVDVAGYFAAVSESHDILRASDLVLVAMGTATLEAAAALTPMVTVYDGPVVAKWIAARVLHQQREFYAMPNILLGRAAVPELVPRAVRERPTGEEIAAAALGILQDEAWLAAMRSDLAQVRGLLGEPGVAQRTADLIAGMVRGEAVRAA